MQDAVNTFLNKQFAEFIAFRRALTGESDRGCALFAAAYLDKTLSDLLFLSLVESKKIEFELFEGNAPLATFSSRIKMAFYLGRISGECRSDLEAIRKIRNDFAHDANHISFETQSIADRCRTLGFSYHLKEARPRAHFTAACCGILRILHKNSLESIAPAIKPDDRPTEAQKASHRESVDKAFQEAHEEPEKPLNAKESSSETEQVAAPPSAPESS